MLTTQKIIDDLRIIEQTNGADRLESLSEAMLFTIRVLESGDIKSHGDREYVIDRLNNALRDGLNAQLVY